MSDRVSESLTLLRRRLLIAREDRELFERMYVAYDHELGQYSERIRNCPVCKDDFQRMYKNPCLFMIFLFNELGQKVGFCLLGHGINTHPDTDYYISEFYVLPEHRRSGIGSKAIMELFSLLPGKYCYHVLKENKAAHLFWDEVKRKANAKVLELKEILDDMADCDFFGFEVCKSIGVLG